MTFDEDHAQADSFLVTRDALDRERRVYAELFDAAPEAYLVTDARGVILKANRSAVALFNVQPAFLVGKPLAALVSLDDRSTFRDLIDAIGESTLRTEVRIQLLTTVSRFGGAERPARNLGLDRKLHSRLMRSAPTKHAKPNATPLCNRFESSSIGALAGPSRARSGGAQRRQRKGRRKGKFFRVRTSAVRWARSPSGFT